MLSPTSKTLSEKYDTQQKALEPALEKLANGSDKAVSTTPEAEFLMRIGSEVKMACMGSRGIT